MEPMTIMTINKSRRSNHLHLHPPLIKSSRLLIGKPILIFFTIRCRLARILILPHQPLHSSNNNICHVLSETSCYFQENIGGNQLARLCKLSGDYRFSPRKCNRLWLSWLLADC